MLCEFFFYGKLKLSFPLFVLSLFLVEFLQDVECLLSVFAVGTDQSLSIEVHLELHIGSAGAAEIVQDPRCHSLDIRLTVL